MIDIDNIQLPSSDKIENDGATSQGKASASEWNLLVKAIEALKGVSKELKSLVEERVNQEIVVDDTLNETSTNPISNNIVTANFTLLRNAISNFFNKFRSKNIEVVNDDEEEMLNIVANSSGAVVRAEQVLELTANGLLGADAEQVSVHSDNSTTISSDKEASLTTPSASITANEQRKVVEINADDVEFTYRSKGSDGEMQESVVTLKNILLGGQLITYDQYKAIKNKEMITYYVAKDSDALKENKCWRIYLRAQLIGQFDVEGNLTLPVFPMRFPFRLA